MCLSLKSCQPYLEAGGVIDYNSLLKIGLSSNPFVHACGRVGKSSFTDETQLITQMPGHQGECQRLSTIATLPRALAKGESLCYTSDY